MKKTLFTFHILAALLLLVAGCEKEDPVVHNNENEISDIWLTIPGQKDVRFDPVLSQNKDTAYFSISYFYPAESDNEVNLEELILRANLPLDAVIKPALGTPMDLSQPVSIEVISGTGEVRPYIIAVKKVADLSVKEISIEVDFEGTLQLIQGFEKEGGEIIFYVPPGFDLSTAKVYPLLSRHSSSSLAEGEVVDLTQPVTLTVTGVDKSSKSYTLKAVPPKRLDYGFGITRMLWNLSGAELGGFSAHAETGMAVSGDHLVVVTNPTPAKYRVYNRFTGASEGEMTMPGSIRSFQITNDEGGHLLGATYAPKGADFILYKWDNALDTTPEEFLRYTNATTSAKDGALGRRVNVIGDISSNAIIMATESREPHFLRWTVANGELVSTTPEVIVYKDPVGDSWPWLSEAQPISTDPNTDFFVNYQSEIALVGGSSHNRVSAFTKEESVVGYFHAPMDYFSFNKAKYLATIKYIGGTSKAAISIFDVTDQSKISTASTDPGFEEFHPFVSAEVSASTPNLNGTGDIEVVISEDGLTAWAYMLLTNGGIIAYELTSYDPN